MGVFGRIGRWIAIAVLTAVASPAAAATASTSGWPHADPAQPLVQAPRVCAPNIVYITHRCHVIDFTPLGRFRGRDWYYAFYWTHWADRHGRIDRGFPIFFYRQGPATLRLGLWINDAPGLAGHWARTPPVRPVIVQDPPETYMGVTLQNVGEAPDQRLFRLRDIRWSAIKILTRSDKDNAILSAATPSGCSIAGDGLYDWSPLTVRYPLKTDLTGEACGVVVAELAVRGDHTRVTRAYLQRPSPPQSLDSQTTQP